MRGGGSGRKKVRVVGSEVLGSRCLPGDHGAGLRMAGGGGGGAELREAAVARLQAGHGTPVEGDRTREQVSRHTLHIGQQTQSNTRATTACQQPTECTLCRTMQLEKAGGGVTLWHTRLRLDRTATTTNSAAGRKGLKTDRGPSNAHQFNFPLREWKERTLERWITFSTIVFFLFAR